MTPRPPQLHLKYDNFKPPSIRSAGPRLRRGPRSFFQELYLASWRNVVVALAGLNALRFTLSAISSFQDVHIDHIEHVPRLARISTTLGAMYVAAVVIEVFGIVSVSTRRLPFIRIYAHLVFVNAIVVTVAAIVSALSYFAFSDDLMKECISLATDGRLHTKSIFRGRPWPLAAISLPPAEAQKQCITAWSGESISQIAAVFLFSLVPSAAYTLFAFTYYRQTTERGHAACLIDIDAGRYTRITNRDDGAGAVQEVATARESARGAVVDMRERVRSGKRKASRSPVRLMSVSQTRLPGPSILKKPARDVTQTYQQSLSLMKSASPTGYMVTPGPPSFGVGPSRVVRPPVAVAAVYTVGEDEEDDVGYSMPVGWQ